VNGLADSYCK